MYIGVDIGGTFIKGVITNTEGKVLSFKKVPTGKTADDIDNIICQLVDNLIQASEVQKRSLKAIGIGAAGAIDIKKGIVITSPNIGAWENYPLAAKIEKKVGIRVFLENDANVAVVGEWWQGNGKKYRNWIMLTLGTGIGGGAVIDNKFYTGQSGSSMEFGHTTIDYRGKICNCGNRGCLEQYASASALVRMAKAGLKKAGSSTLHDRLKDETISAKMIHEEALRGDVFCIDLLTELAFYLGIGVSNLVNIFNPQAVIFGGGLSRAHDIILPVVRKVVDDRALPGLKDNVKYLLIKDENRAPALGAAKIAIDSLHSY